jgi:hypothetical protein
VLYISLCVVLPQLVVWWAQASPERENSTVSLAVEGLFGQSRMIVGKNTIG